LASAIGISPLVIGFFLVSLGTDFPEIINSIISSSAGHADINVGNSIGSVLAQLTLVLGLLPFFGKSFKVKRNEVLVTGSCLIISLMLVYTIVEKGFISRLNAAFMIGSFPIYLLITYLICKRRAKLEIIPDKENRVHHLTIAILGFGGVALGAYGVVQSAIILSRNLGISELIFSFFILSIGTSLPELVVDLTAVRQGHYEVAIGDIIGSCVIDSSFSVGIGTFLFPQKIAGTEASITVLYSLFASIMVILLLALRKKVDKRSGILFMILYFSSFIIIETILLFFI
jgi:cation:H+ antiporter